MKTMERLCKRFNRIHKPYTATLNTLDSYRGYYRVCIANKISDFFDDTCYYTFRSCAEFREWIDGVIMNG